LGALVAGFAAARGAVLLMLAPVIHRAAGTVRGFRPSIPVLGNVLKPAGWMLAGSGLSVFVVPLSRWCIAAGNGVAAVPVFDIAYTGSMQIRNVLEFGLRSLVPEAASLKARGNVHQIQRLYAVWTRRMLAAGVALYGLASLAAPWLLTLWLGDRLAPGQLGIFRLFLIAGFFSLLGTPAYYLLVGSHKLRDVFWSYVVQAGVNAAIILTAFLWPVSDVVRMSGVAMGTAMLASTIVLMLRLKKSYLSGEEEKVKDPACCPV
jgi:O-antigen/teichoic acid export membrane protein